VGVQATTLRVQIRHDAPPQVSECKSPARAVRMNFCYGSKSAQRKKKKKIQKICTRLRLNELRMRSAATGVHREQPAAENFYASFNLINLIAVLRHASRNHLQ
jgi:secreted trypsin-like serine protease